MDVRTVNNLPPAAAHYEAVRCLLAIELSKKSWIVAVNTPLSEKISRYRLKGCDWKGLLELIEKILGSLGQKINEHTNPRWMVTVCTQGCNTPFRRWVPPSLEPPLPLAMLHEGPWYGFSPDRI